MTELKDSAVNKKGKEVLKKFMTVVFPNKVKETHPARQPRHHYQSKIGSLDLDDLNTELKNRSQSMSSITKLAYNPYGIYKPHDIISLEQAFNNGIKISEPEHRLTSPLHSPNDYLPQSMKQKHVNLEDKYELLDFDVGHGGSATIKKVLLKSPNNTTKVLALKKFSLFNTESQLSYYQRVAHEFIITKSIKHPNCILCIDLVQLPVTLQNAWGMTMEYFQYDLFKLVKLSNWKNVEIGEKMCIFKQICFGVKFLHENDLVHLDLKAENVMVSKNGLMKITDYGCLEVGHVEHKNFDSPVSYLNKRLGTPPYQPPEVARYNIINDDTREPFCPFHFDYWSLGILLFFVITGRAPFAYSKESDSGYKLFTMEYVQMVEKVPNFLDNFSMRIPKIGVFSDPHGNDPLFLYFFWRFCDPNPRTRLTIPKLFKIKEFQDLEMCVDERMYQSNFYCHSGSKDMSFTVPYGSLKEITQQKEIKHSLWDEIPTVPKSDGLNRKYRSLVPQTSSSGSSVLKEKNVGHSIPDQKNDTSSQWRPGSMVSDADHEWYGSPVTATPQNVLPLSHHEPSCINTPFPNIETKPFVLTTNDYDINSSTKFMIVDIKDIFAAASCSWVPHSHNSLYFSDRHRSHTISLGQM